MELSKTEQTRLAVGAIIGAILGLGAVWLLMNAPSNLDEGETPAPISAKEILGITGTAAMLIRSLDDFRRRL